MTQEFLITWAILFWLKSEHAKSEDSRKVGKWLFYLCVVLSLIYPLLSK